MGGALGGDWPCTRLPGPALARRGAAVSCAPRLFLPAPLQPPGRSAVPWGWQGPAGQQEKLAGQGLAMLAAGPLLHLVQARALPCFPPRLVYKTRKEDTINRPRGGTGRGSWCHRAVLALRKEQTGGAGRQGPGSFVPSCYSSALLPRCSTWALVSPQRPWALKVSRAAPKEPGRPAAP